MVGNEALSSLKANMLKSSWDRQPGMKSAFLLAEALIEQSSSHAVAVARPHIKVADFNE
jgi:hypothetical protein